MRAGRPALALLLLLAAGGAEAQEVRLGLRSGEHPGRSRLVLDWPRRPEYQAEQTGDRLLLRLPPGVVPGLDANGRLARNVLGLARVPEGLLLTLRPGVRVRHFVMDNRLVLDLSDPGAEPEPPRAAEATPPPRAAEAAPPPRARRGRAEQAASAPAEAPAAAPARTVAAPAAPAPPAPPPGPAVAVLAPVVAPAPVAPAAAPLPEPAPPPLPAAAAPRPPGAQVLRQPPPTRPAAPAREPVLTAAPREAPTQLALPAPARGAPVPPAPSLAAAPAAPVAVLAPVVVPPPAAPAPAAAPVAVLAPLSALPVRVLALPGQPPALHLPYVDTPGLALLRRGEALLLAFASPQPLDLSAVRSTPLFAQVEVQAVPGGMVLRLPLAPPAGIQPRREGPGWVLQFTRGEEPRDAAPEPRALAPEAIAGTPPRFVLRASKPGQSLSLTDPETGLPLLLGTVQEPGQAVPLPRRLAEFELPPTLLGLAVLARADRVTLTPRNDSFVIGAAGGAQLALDPAVAAPIGGAPAMTRSFDLAGLPVPALLNRLRSQQRGIAQAAPLARAMARRDAAETLLSLGMGQEAQAMAALAMAEDPAAAADPRTVGLQAVGATLAGRPAEARALRDGNLPDTDEATLWRAALAMRDQQPERAAPGFAATLPLLLDYPPPLRDRLLPLAAEALVHAGDIDALGQLLAAVPQGLPLARAALLQAQGKTAEALAGYDAVAAGRNRRSRALALRRALDLRLDSGAITPAAAARALDAALFAWRGDEVEIAARRRLAELRVLAKAPRDALALLQETTQLFPEQAAALRPAQVSALLAALRDEPPLSAVALHDANAELLQDDPRAEQAALLLADRLVALDLTERAAQLLARTAERAAEPVTRASLGLRLATLRLDEGNAPAALAALETTQAEALPEEVSRARVVLAARAEARRGNLAQAVEGLESLGPPGDGPLVELLAEAQDWPAAAAAGQRVLAALPPAPAPLEAEQQRALLRQAALLVLAGDEAGLGALRPLGARLPAGLMAEGFTALAAESLKGLADLPRLSREQQLFRNLPRRLEALRAGAPVTR